MKRFPNAWGFLLFAAMAGFAQAGDLAPGQAFPEIALPSVENGSALSIGEFRGEKVMLHLFASW